MTQFSPDMADRAAMLAVVSRAKSA